MNVAGRRVGRHSVKQQATYRAPAMDGERGLSLDLSTQIRLGVRGEKEHRW